MAEYIEREAAIKRFNFAVLDCLGMEPTIRAGDIIKALESIPAADVVPMDFHERCLQIEIQKRMALEKADVRPAVRGKWTHRKSKLYTMCSACGYGYSNSHYHEVEKFKFCPNCGAMMEASDGKD